MLRPACMFLMRRAQHNIIGSLTASYYAMYVLSAVGWGLSRNIHGLGQSFKSVESSRRLRRKVLNIILLQSPAARVVVVLVNFCGCSSNAMMSGLDFLWLARSCRNRSLMTPFTPSSATFQASILPLHFSHVCTSYKVLLSSREG